MRISETEHYSQETDGIRITVFPEYLEESSDPTESTYAFSYTIAIENLTSYQVKLLERHWVISSGGSHLAEVVGPGVLGEQPSIDAGEIFEYTSTTVIQDPMGRMEGSYTFRTEDGRYLEVPIPSFELHYPIVFH
ncbi:MAG: Co2+/Mg2+ efflux protein ApaG [Bdellovibrionales bacterium]|nr:Co2+/Mg2+ efflux protein ApaG [Bdellovibrionales bacterium]